MNHDTLISSFAGAFVGVIVSQSILWACTRNCTPRITDDAELTPVIYSIPKNPHANHTNIN